MLGTSKSLWWLFLVVLVLMLAFSSGRAALAQATPPVTPHPTHAPYPAHNPTPGTVATPSLAVAPTSTLIPTIKWDVVLSVLGVLTPLLLAVLGGLGWLYRHERERREAVERQLSEHKYNTYVDLLNIFFDVLQASKVGKTISQEELVPRMFNTNKELIMYGSDDVLRLYQDWLMKTRRRIFDPNLFGEIVVAIRRDMGNPKTQIEGEDVLKFIISDYEEAKASGKLAAREVSEK